MYQLVCLFNKAGFKYFIIFGCTGSLLLWVGVLQLQGAGAPPQVWCVGFLLQRLLLRQSPGSGASGASAAAARG